MPTVDFHLPPGDWGDDQGETISEEEARKILIKRLNLDIPANRPVPEQTSREARTRFDLVEHLLAAMPEQMRTADVLNNVDLRMVLRHVMSTSWGAEQRGDYELNGQTFAPAEQMLAGSLFVDQRQRLETQIRTQLQDTKVAADTIPDIVLEDLNHFRDAGPGELQRVPVYGGTVAYDPATGTATTVGATPELNDAVSIFNDITTGRSTGDTTPGFLTPEDVRILFSESATPGAAVNAYLDDLSARGRYARETGAEAPPDQLVVEMDERSHSWQGGRTGSPSARASRLTAAEENQTRTGATSYSLSRALQLPVEMTRAEVNALTNKMRKAGLFAQVGGEPLVKGDPADPQFKDAYRLLLGKSIELGRNVNSILDSDTLAYQEEIEDAVRARLTDPAKLNLTADSLGRQVLGRKLTNAQKAELVKIIHGFEREQAMDEGDPNATGDVVEVDWSARMEEYIGRKFPAEAAANDTADQYDQFRSLLAGPGGLS